MTVNHRKNDNPLKMAIPLLDAQGNVEGWYKFDDEYLSPEVRYTAIPPTTWVKIGGRYLEIDRAVPLKIRLLEEEEDYHFWCNKKQHSQRINCGEYHKDFGDVEVGYSFSSPQTHIWFAGYAIHTDAFENCHFSSHNATVRVTPEHVIPKRIEGEALRHSISNKEAAERMAHGDPRKLALTDLAPSKSLFEMVVEEGADFPIYTAALPVRRMTNKGPVLELVPTAEFINDCEREIIRRDQWDVGAAVSHASSPTSYPPTFPPVKPFENSSLFWSFIYNQLLGKRLKRDELEQAYKDIALLNRLQQYDLETLKRDKEYRKALDRLAYHFSRKDHIHKATWPTTDAKCEECKCVVCQQHKIKKPKSRRYNSRSPSPQSPQLSHKSSYESVSTSSGESRHYHSPPREHRHHTHYHSHETRGGSRHRTPASPPRRSVSRHEHHYRRHSKVSTSPHQPQARETKRHHHRHTNTRHHEETEPYSPSSASSSHFEARLREREEAARKLANCWKPSMKMCAIEDVAASSTPPSVLSVPLYFNAGGIRQSVPGGSAAIFAPHELNQKLPPAR